MAVEDDYKRINSLAALYECIRCGAIVANGARYLHDGWHEHQTEPPSE